MLSISPETQQKLADEDFQRRAVSFFRRNLPSHTEGLSDGDLHATVDRAMVTGRHMGVTSERELVKWSFIGLLTRGSAFEDEQLKTYISSFGAEDNGKVDAVLQDLAEEIERRG